MLGCFNYSSDRRYDDVPGQLLGHSNLVFCFTSRIAKKSDPVGRSIFVNVLYEYHYKIMNLINSKRCFPPCPRVSLQLWLTKLLVILAPHFSLYFCTDPHCQRTASLPSPTIQLWLMWKLTAHAHYLSHTH